MKYPDRCTHCATPLSGGGVRGFCCTGCERVHALLSEGGLDRYYDLRGRAAGLPVGDLDPEARDRAWLEPMVEDLGAAEGLQRVALDVQGVHCAACVWLIQEVFDREEGAQACVVNPTRGRVELTVEPSFDLARWVSHVEGLGYLLGPALKGRSAAADDLTLRMGISVALALNVMLFTLASYLGLTEGPIRELFRQIAFGLAVATVLVGGTPFFQAAYRSLRQGLLHLDLPIALGIGLAFAGSLHAFLADSGAEYFDSVAIFIALMLVGRWVRERVVARNRSQLLATDGVEGLWTRRVEGPSVARTRCVDIDEGDTLLVSPGDLIPVDAELIDGALTLRLDWINGEAAPRAYEAGAVAPAGAFHAGERAVRVRARTDFDDSALVELLASPRERTEGAKARSFWDRLARFYVLGVLGAGAAAFLLEIWRSGDVNVALGVTTAVLVVTCPCAFGIAAPLAYELAQAGLRRAGLFVRSRTLLDRAPQVERIVFDKTGTLTTGAPSLRDPALLAALPDADRAALHDLVARSTHPKSAAVLDAFGDDPPALRSAVAVHESAGNGLQANVEGHLYRLGRPGWAAPERAFAPEVDLVLTRDGGVRAAFSTEETLRPDAAGELRRLEALGYELFILSGDAQAKVDRIAAALGVPPERALGEHSPRDKADWLRAHDPDRTLFIGDGINDSLAADVALVAGTPAIDRPFMPARSDFYFVTPGLGPLRRLLTVSKFLHRVVRGDLLFAISYNAGAVLLAMMGLVQPWVAAILMPSSSITSIAATAVAMTRRTATWKS
jgi:Cu2+-exporting ATPase